MVFGVGVAGGYERVLALLRGRCCFIVLVVRIVSGAVAVVVDGDVEQVVELRRKEFERVNFVSFRHSAVFSVDFLIFFLFRIRS